MDIKQFEEMIIDYLDGNLSDTNKKYFEEALNSSEECRELFKQYRSIREVSGSDQDLTPSGEVLERISEQVKQSVKHEKKSIYEKWSKFPVLAPALAVAIIAMLWISAGEDYLKNKNILPESEKPVSSELRSDYKASAGKLNKNVSTAEEELLDREADNIDSLGKRERASRFAASAPAPSVGEKKKQEYAANPAEAVSADNMASVPVRQQDKNKDMPKAVKSADVAIEENDKFADLKEAGRDNVYEEDQGEEPNATDLDKGGIESDTSKRSETIGSSYSQKTTPENTMSTSERVEIANNYRNELNKIVTMQYRGDCEQSLERSQELLEADPEPSVSIKTDLYVIQGECFMELGQYDDALAVYEKAKELTPHKSHFFNVKIKEIYIQQTK